MTYERLNHMVPLAGRPVAGAVAERLVGGSCQRLWPGLLAALLGLSVPSAGLLASEVASAPVGIYHLNLVPGPNCISVPLHPIHAYRGLVGSVTANTITLQGTPGWTENAFAPQDSFTQYIAILLHDASENPGNQGDWWPILSNTSDTLTLNPRNEDLSTLVGAGDQVEVRRLTSLKDLFGYGATAVMNKDTDRLASTATEDTIRYLVGSNYGPSIYYHDGSLTPEGYYRSMTGPLDGSTLTVLPGQTFMFFRKTGSVPLRVACRGQVQQTRLTHYLTPPRQTVGVPFPVESPVSSAGLLEAGWVSDTNRLPSTGTEDVIRPIVGSNYGASIIYHDGTVSPAGWYMLSGLTNSFPLEPSKSYMFFLLGSQTIKWRQPTP